MFGLLVQCLLVTFSTSVLSTQPRRNRSWNKVRQGDVVRSPCPALNALSNEGILNQNGKGILLSDMQSALMSVYNLDEAFSSFLVYTGKSLVSNDTTEAQSGTIDLDNLDKHGGVEHDASLTRENYSEGDQVNLNRALFDAMLADSDTDFLTVASLAKSRVRREDHSASVGDPVVDQKTLMLTYGESALILLCLAKGTDADGNPMALKTDVQRWFVDERLPDGFVKPVVVDGIATNEALAGKIQTAALALRAN